ncbi:hypothetical protein GGR54DRAFT_636341 [Hypoxylon sp. NC1633]|nr:hypothetical protein GGR54DRAFT_636341 [Hypoxylon sp. NC1633]
MSDLYAHGVDAHCGMDIPKPLEMLEESPRQTPVPVDNFPFPDTGPRWPHDLNEGLEIGSKKTGSAIGAASHRRKSASKPIEARSPDQGRGLLDQLRRYSFMPLLDHTPESIREASPPTRTWAEIPLRGDGGRKQSSKELLQEILDGKPASNRSSRVSSQGSSRSGFLRRRKRTNSGKAQKRPSGAPGRVSCSEDQTPHICVDEQLTPLSGSEPTWLE